MCHSTGLYQLYARGTRGAPTFQQQLKLTALPQRGIVLAASRPLSSNIPNLASLGTARLVKTLLPYKKVTVAVTCIDGFY